jgi:hypothetical protein
LCSATLVAVSAQPPPQTMPQALPARPKAQTVELVAMRDPFSPFTVAARASAPAPNAPGRVGPAFAGGGTQVPNPGSAGGAGNLVVLCSTIASGTNPQAAFLVGNSVVFASLGDPVGGYRVSSIDVDHVTFEDGSSLLITPCGGASEGSGVAPAGIPSYAQPAPAAPSGASLPAFAPPTVVPKPGAYPGQGSITPPTQPYSQGATPLPAINQVPYPGSGTESNSLYGGPAPTPVPYNTGSPIIIRQPVTPAQ